MENVLESYGIAADGRDISKALMKALAERKEVTLLGGVFHTGPLMLPSGSRLEIAEDAVLQFIPDFSLYPPVFTRWEGVRCWAMHPCIYINEADDVTICGKGEINGSGKPWWDIVFDRRRLGVKEPQAEIEKYSEFDSVIIPDVFVFRQNGLVQECDVVIYKLDANIADNAFDLPPYKIVEQADK